MASAWYLVPGILVYNGNTGAYIIQVLAVTQEHPQLSEPTTNEDADQDNTGVLRVYQKYHTWYLLPDRLPVFIMTGIDPYKPAVSKCNKYTYRSTWYHGPS